MIAKAMDKKEQDKLEKYGKLVCQFANAKKTDDILISFFNNLQSAFNFSKDFTKKALKQFPTKKIITDSLTDRENELLEILWKRNNILKSCNAELSHIYCHVDKYDPIKETFTIIARIYFEGIPDKNQDYFEDTHLILKKETEEFIRYKTESYYDNYLDKDIFTDKSKEVLEALVAICHNIEEIRQGATNRFAEIEKLAETYQDIYCLHNYAKENQENIKSILLKIIKSKNAYEAKAFKTILDGYNKIKTEYIVNKKHELVLKEPFIEENFFKDLQVAKTNISEAQLLFNNPINYCLVEYLKNPKYSGKEKISICQDCECFFCKSKLNRYQRYCPICSKKNHTPKDIQAKRTKTSRAAKKKREVTEKRKELYEEKYKQLIKEKFSEKEAQQFAKQYVIEQMP